MSNKDESSLKDERRGISARDGKTPGRKGEIWTRTTSSKRRYEITAISLTSLN
jgi:hypothetical protein